MNFQCIPVSGSNNGVQFSTSLLLKVSTEGELVRILPASPWPLSPKKLGGGVAGVLNDGNWTFLGGVHNPKFETREKKKIKYF